MMTEFCGGEVVDRSKISIVTNAWRENCSYLYSSLQSIFINGEN